jgi:methionyl aminopeptidase
MIVLRSDDEIAYIRKAGEILAETLEALKARIRPGVQTKELDEIARQEILKRNGYPAFKGYKGFPANICTSINEVVVHGIPSGRKLREGDIVSIDIGVKFRDYFADAAVTLGVGRISEEARRLMAVTEKALAIGIANALPGKRLYDISAKIQQHVESNGFSVVRTFVGHGIGTKIHEEPEVPNFGSAGTGPRLESGMVLAIEPMVNAGTCDVEILGDGWTAVTKDRRLSAHFEHTIAVRKDGVEVLTVLGKQS